MESVELRMGVYICHCGVNIAGVVDVEEVRKYAETLPHVALAKTYVYMCSAPAQAMIKNDIKQSNLNRVVVAACSPRMHETTFRKVVEEGGLNSYLFDMVNIREHCSWVHSSEPKNATKKAQDLVRMMLAKAALLEPLQKKEVKVTVRALVIGAGVAGLTAALDLAERGFEVYIVDKAPCIGGRMTQLGQVFPTGEQASDILSRIVDEVYMRPSIKLLTNTEVESVDGYIGNFKVKLTAKPRYVSEKCDACGKCTAVCPVDVPNEFDFGLTKRRAIYVPHPQASPRTYLVDAENCNRCGECINVCEREAVNLDQSPLELELDVGTIIVATGFDPYQPPKGEFGYGESKNVITTLELERLLDPNGPTKGELLPNSEGSKNIVFISCVGSRQEPGVYRRLTESQQLNRYCSRVCCTTSLKSAMEVKERYPDAKVFYLYRDIRTHGRGHEDYYKRASESFIYFIKYAPEEPPKVTCASEKLNVRVQDLLTENNRVNIKADLVVLATGMTARADVNDIQSKLKIPRGADGFFSEAHAKLRPLDTATEGIFLAGTAQGPKDITESAFSGSAAAAKAAIPLARRKVELEPIKASVDMSRCDGCALCIEACTFKALAIEEVAESNGVKKRARLNEALCKGCGACAATCPPKALSVKHFTLDQLSAMIDAALAA